MLSVAVLVIVLEKPHAHAFLDRSITMTRTGRSTTPIQSDSVRPWRIKEIRRGLFF
jgi:hypothetical protein